MSVVELIVERKRKQSLMEGGRKLYVCVASGARTCRITNFATSRLFPHLLILRSRAPRDAL